MGLLGIFYIYSSQGRGYIEEVMKKFIIIIYLCFPLVSFAEVGDTYHCTELFHKGVLAPPGGGGKVVA